MHRRILTSCAFSIAAVIGYTVVYGQADLRPFQEGRSVCVPYDPASLVIKDSGRGNWQLERADGAIFRVFADKEDAEAGLVVAKQNNQLCYIGKSNTRPNRTEFVMEYWRKK